MTKKQLDKRIKIANDAWNKGIEEKMANYKPSFFERLFGIPTAYQFKDAIKNRFEDD